MTPLSIAPSLAPAPAPAPSLRPLGRALLAAGLMAASVWMGATPARAATASAADDMPPEAQVRVLILARPEVRGAVAALRADQAESERLSAGPHEFTVRLAGQRRSASDLGTAGLPQTRHLGEGQLSLERTLRAGGKAAADQAIGEAGVALARLRQADAIHETTRVLLRLWFDWLRERATTVLWRDQLAAQDGLLRQTDRRVQAGDASRTELSLQQAAFAQMQAGLAAAQAREQTARAALDVHFPGLSGAAVADVSLPGQRDDAGDARGGAGEAALEVLRQLEDGSHEWAVARLQAALARERAQRATLERRPDPTVGVYVASERAGTERVVGLSLTLPLPGAARDSGARAALASADAAAEQAEQVRLKVRAEAAAQWVGTQAAFETWQRFAQARDRTEQAMKAVLRGWQLGEYGQAEVLLARRQFIDASLAELAARAEARHAAERLRLDLHQILDFDDA
jgi:outer membrane protein TolC